MGRSFVRLNVVALLLCAMVLRGIIPAGWMPDTASSGPGLVICTADGLHRASPVDSPHGHDPASHHDNTLCPFAATAQLATSQAPEQLAVASLTGFFHPLLSQGLSLRATTREHSHAPRAPPSLA